MIDKSFKIFVALCFLCCGLAIACTVKFVLFNSANPF